MCLITFSYKQHPFYDLVFIANRDEFYDRPARTARYWDRYPDLLAGKDLQAGGTWMGINRSGHFAALTNFRDMRREEKNSPSRGDLVLDYLLTEEQPDSYLRKTDGESDRYNGFNLLAGNLEELFCYSNRNKKIIRLKPGLYGLSNHLLETPWRKVTQAKQKLSDQLHQDELDVDALFEILQDDTPAPDSELPDTGLPKELERAVSSIFIRTEKYGTRCSTLLLIDKEGKATFEERSYIPGTKKVQEVSRHEFEFENV